MIGKIKLEKDKKERKKRTKKIKRKKKKKKKKIPNIIFGMGGKKKGYSLSNPNKFMNLFT